jgi:hypothetical protein
MGSSLLRRRLSLNVDVPAHRLHETMDRNIDRLQT